MSTDRNFTINVDKIKQNKFYNEIIKAMPKGALLHCHVSAIVNVYDYLQYLKTNAKDVYDKMYFLTDTTKLNEYKKFILDNYQAFYDEIQKIDEVKNILNLPAPPVPPAPQPPTTYDKTYSDFVNGVFGKLILNSGENSLMYFSNNPFVEGYKQINTMTDEQIKNICDSYRMKDITQYNWTQLRNLTNPYWTLYRDREFYLHYFRFFLNNCIAENLQHVEIKMALAWFYDTKKSDVTVNGQKIDFYYTQPYEDRISNDINVIKEFLIGIRNLQKELAYKDKITFTLIGAIGKSRKTEYCKKETCASTKCEKTLMNCVHNALSNICTVEELDAIDLQGEEDETIPTSLYLGTLIKDCSTKNLVIHSGETITDDTIYNNNLMSMAYLKNSNLDANRYLQTDPLGKPLNFFTKKIHRVGHGLDLERSGNSGNYELYNMFKKLKIHVELCPLSNYILNYTKDLSQHPGKKYLADGIRVSINSDDPSPFGYDDVSFDWLFAIMYWNLTFSDIKKMAIYSLEDSLSDDVTKQNNIEKFKKAWDAWVSNLKISPSDNDKSLNDLFKTDFDTIKALCTLTQTQQDTERAFQHKEAQKTYKSAHQVGGYKEKYLKYKQKYLQLKKQL